MAAPRKFDHDEARARYMAGERISALAREFGVTYNAVLYVVDDRARARSRQNNKEWHRSHRASCRGGCGRLVWVTTHRSATGYCRRCFGLVRAESVDDTTLRCSLCGEWKPDKDFPRSSDNIARRFRHDRCRTCQTVARRTHRAQMTDEQRELVRERDRMRKRRVRLAA